VKKIEKILDILGTKKAIIISLAFAIILPSSFVIAEFPSNEQPYPAKFYAMCFDKKDNDGDGKIDLQDSDCPKCSDGKDNDGDGLIDEKDPDCPKEAPKTSFWGAAAAILGVSQANSGENSSASPQQPMMLVKSPNLQTLITLQKNDYINNPLNCNQRISVFQKKVRDYNGGWHYEYTFYCLPLDSSQLKESTNLKGSEMNFSSSVIGAGTYIGSYTSIGAGSTIGKGTDLAPGNSIQGSNNLSAGTNIGTGTTIGSGNTITPSNPISSGSSISPGTAISKPTFVIGQ
jgi:hypothetical protein